MISIIIVDDHKLVRDGIKAFTLGNKEMKLMGEASNADELFQILKENLPDVLVLDISLRGLTGIEITRKVTTLYPKVKTLILSAYDDEQTIINAIHAGAGGFLHKDTGKKEFLKAVKTVYNNEGYFGENLSNIIYKSYITKVKSKDEPTDKKSTLSERELDVIRLFSEGLSFKEIADRLHISPRTVETHKNNILNKLELKNTIELVKFSIKEGIIQL